VWNYSFFGLNARSNVQFARIPPAESANRPVECELHLGVYPDSAVLCSQRTLIYTSPFTDSSGEPALKMWGVGCGTYLHLAYNDGHQFWFDRAGTQVWVTWPSNSSLEEATNYLLGPVLGILLRYRGIVCLHASSVAVDGRAVAFVGPPGAGKSTTAAALAKRGHPVLADDVTAIREVDGKFYAYPAYPGLWLWPDSVELLYGAGDDRPKPIREGDKARISANSGLAFEVRPLPLARIYILDFRGCSDEVSTIESLTQGDFLSLVANTYATNLLDAKMRAHELTVLGKLVPSVPVLTLPSFRSPGKLQEWIISLEEILSSVGGVPKT
jgi:hypothetical protein